MKSFILILSSLWFVSTPPTAEIKVDQVGYLSNLPKIAFVVSATTADKFMVRRKSDDSVAFEGKLSTPVHDLDSGDPLQTADFTKLDLSGTFYLDVPGVGRSWNFAIGPDVYRHTYYLAVRAFYGLRCGAAVDLGPEFPGYKHAACHLAAAYHSSSGKNGSRKSAKGWHDAGDYGRYIVNSGISTGELLWAWAMFAPRLKDIKLNLPETGNGTPDMLNEIRWNLDWMLSMQDTDGGVWHKQTSEQFAPFIMPEKDSSISYVIGTGRQPFKGSCATADFAAVMAIAARVFQPFDLDYSQTCSRAATAAWFWLAKNPKVLYRNPASVGTGAYGDDNCGDEQLWAAAELSRTTSEGAYLKYFRDHFSEYTKSITANGPPSWNSVAPLALWTYILGDGKDRNASKAIRQLSLKAADEIVERTTRSGYRNSMTSRDYIWGSNGVVANYGVQLLVANAIRPDPRYRQTAIENLHYLLGRNTFSLSWVTRVGENPFRHPHHRPSESDSNFEPWPGLLSGGPNQRRQDPAMRKLSDRPPAKMYLDEQESFASNEVAINWNAPLVFLLAGTLPQEEAKR